MLRVFYDPINGDSVPDGKCADKAKACELMAKSDTDFEIILSSEVAIAAIRVLIRAGDIPLDRIQVYYRDSTAHYEEQINFDKDGRSPNWPKGFCDTYQDFLMELF
jgi:hypothetical protein